MVVFEATIEVTQYREIMSGDRKGGSDPVKRSVTLEESHTVHIDEEFPKGHVNLEAWIPSLSPDVFHEKMTDMANTLFNGEVEVEEFDVSIYGNKREWITQIDRYMDERPEMDFSECLYYFKDCEEVSMPMNIIDELVGRREIEV